MREDCRAAGSGTNITVVGGVNIDIGGRSFAPLIERDSNPGRVTVSLGGVGRNIAHNLSLMRRDVCLLTALGDDPYAQRVMASCAELGIDIRHALLVPEGTTSTYIYLDDSNGDMAVALSDMEICDRITPAYLERQESVLAEATLVIADTNIPEESLQWITDHVKAPLFVDPVSTRKAEKLRKILGKIHTLKPNRIEAELLSGIRITDETSLRIAAGKLLETGLRRVFITLGGDGVLAAGGREMIRVPCCRAETRNTTGAGDAFTAALAWAFTEGYGLRETCEAAAAAAALAVESAETVNPAISPDAIRRRMPENET